MEFAIEYPDFHRVWHKESNYVIALAKPDERALFDFAKKLETKGFRVCRFYEPDIQELTAIAVVPEQGVREACSGIPLAGKINDPVIQEHLRNREKLLKNVISEMEDCKNSLGQSVLEHGLSVKDHLFDLIEFLRNPEAHQKFSWKYPQWIFRHTNNILQNVLDEFTLQKYAVMHDCGKPFCKTIDENGRVHYPGHSLKSFEVFKTFNNDPIIAELIKRDMDMHTMDSSLIVEDNQIRSKEEVKKNVTLLITALSEIHANAELFGGLNSDSFRIKWKQLDRIGNLLLDKCFT